MSSCSKNFWLNKLALKNVEKKVPHRQFCFLKNWSVGKWQLCFGIHAFRPLHACALIETEQRWVLTQQLQHHFLSVYAGSGP